LNMMQPSNGAIAGFYQSVKCGECAGPSKGSLVSELELKEDSTFILSHCAIRPAFNDTVTYFKMEGGWRPVKDKIMLKPGKYETTEVDSLYNPLPKKNIYLINRKNAKELSISLRNKMKGSDTSQCSEVYSKQDKNIHEGMERK
jgi:hypothetical protein